MIAALSHTLLHGDQSIAFGDRGYATGERSLDAPRQEHDVMWETPFKRKKGQDLTDELRRINHLVSSIRAPIEHVFRIIKRQFGYTWPGGYAAISTMPARPYGAIPPDAGRSARSTGGPCTWCLLMTTFMSARAG